MAESRGHAAAQATTVTRAGAGSGAEDAEDPSIEQPAAFLQALRSVIGDLP